MVECQVSDGVQVDGPRVVQYFGADLKHASNKFKGRSSDYKNLMPNAGFGSPTCGDTQDVLDVTLRTLGEMHLVLAQALYQHGAKLRKAADVWSGAEQATTVDVKNVLNDMQMAPSGAPPRDDPPVLASDRSLANNTDLNLRNLPEVHIPAQRPVVPQCSYCFIDTMAFSAMQSLASELYQFASQSSSQVVELARYVERLAGDTGDWKGDAATHFRYSFGGDAIIMNGVARIACAVGQVVDDLAGKVATLEAKLDQVVELGISQGFFEWAPLGSFGSKIVAANITGGSVSVTSKAGPNVDGLYFSTLALWHKSQAAAAQYHATANSQLAVLCAPVTLALDTYTSSTGQQFEREPIGLLRADQVSNDTRGVNRLKSRFTAATQSSGVTAAQLGTVATSLAKLGGDAAAIGNVVGTLAGHATIAAEFGESASVLGTVGPIVEDIGLTAALLE